MNIYHNNYLAVFLSILHLPIPDICQTRPDTTQKLSDAIQTHLRHTHIWPAGGHWEKMQYMNTMIFI